MTIQIISLLLLTIATWDELYRERKGETSSQKLRSTLRRGFWMVIFSFMVVLLENIFNGTDPTWWRFIECLILSAAFHFLVFDFIENYNLKRNVIISSSSKWWSYIGQTSTIDRIKFWVKIGWKWRLFIKIAVFVMATIIYFT
jgi:hypothetical protein